MGAVYIQINNAFIKRSITHDYTDSSSSLGVLDKDLCIAGVAADFFPFSGGAEIAQANEKRMSEGARLG